MAELGTTYETENMPQGQGNFEPIPAGWYSAVITSGDVKDTKAGTGKYIAVRFDVTGPEHEGRVLFGNITMQNPNSQAEEIGRQQLGDIMRAIGLARLNNTDQMIGHELMIKVATTKSEQYGPGNEVKGYKAIEGRSGVAPVQTLKPVTSLTPAPRPTEAKSPWKK